MANYVSPTKISQINRLSSTSLAWFPAALNGWDGDSVGRWGRQQYPGWKIDSLHLESGVAVGIRTMQGLLLGGAMIRNAYISYQFSHK